MALKQVENMTSSVGDSQQVDKMQTYWKREIERATKFFSEKFWPKADKLYKLYAKQNETDDGKRRFAMLWANTEVLKPSVYARPPIPQVSRRYRDKDPVGRLAAELLERAATFEFERMNIDSVLRAVRDDLLLPGRGQAWVRYEADIDGDQIAGHRAVCEYVHYRQFLHAPARRWEEVPWVAKIAYVDDEEGRERFGAKWKGVVLDNKTESAGDSDEVKDPALVNAQNAKATVYEIWSKKHRKVFFVAKSCNHLLGEEEPLLDIEGFFPCPRPVYATLTNNSLLPTPDYRYYQDQAEEIDRLTDRIDSLTTNLKLVGFYPAGAEGDVSSALEKALSPQTQNAMIPIASWAAFGERGGSNAIVWLPIKDVVETVRACVELRNQIIQDTYQITGISDILRGQTEASETATAQSIKAQWGSIRIQDRQAEMVRFARDLTRMVCEIISEEFDPEYVLAMANMPRPPQPEPPDFSMFSSMPPPQDEQQAQQLQQMQQQMEQQAQQAMMAWQAENQKIDEAFALLKDERLRGFRVEIETDSTIQPDEDAEKQRRTEFVTAIGGILQQAVPMVTEVPELAGLVSETLLFVARGFRAGRQLEDQIEQSMNAVQERIKQQQQAQPPEDPTIALQAQKLQQEVEHKGQMNAMEQQHKATMNQLEIQKAMEQHEAELHMKGQSMEHELQSAKAQSELGLQTGKAKLREQILSEDQEAFLGQPTEQINGVAQVIQQMMEGFAAALQQSNMTVIQSNQQLVQALQRPKTITAPDGRTYTATVN